ncbi:MAG: hypothetical protein ACPG5B_01705 [Chitinophagales bacterium]
MKKSILLLGLSLGIFQVTYAQDAPKIENKQTIDIVPNVINSERDADLLGIEYHQIYLEKPAESIKNVRYKESEGVDELDGELSEDGLKILLLNYTKRGRVLVDIVYKDGTTEEMSKGSCFIDPVPPM